jgi:hypothetical protein
MQPVSHLRNGAELIRIHPTATKRGSRFGCVDLSSLTPKIIQKVITALILVTASFYAGFFIGIHFSKHVPSSPQFNGALVEEVVQQRVAEELIRRGCARVEEPLLGDRSGQQGKQPITMSDRDKATRIFNPELSGLAKGMVRSKKNDFLAHFDYGLPKSHQIEDEASDVIILYSHADSMPSSLKSENSMTGSSNGIPLLTASLATENCELLSVLVTGRQKGSVNRCVAIMDGSESFHLQRWMRMGSSTAKSPLLSFNKNHPLRHVSRGLQPNGVAVFDPPKTRQIEDNWQYLRKYLNSVEDILKRLRPIAKRTSQNNTIIVMVCNMGQSSLMMNFACAARAKGLDLSKVLVFCTDEETLALAHALGLAAFYDKEVRFELNNALWLYY